MVSIPAPADILERKPSRAWKISPDLVAMLGDNLLGADGEKMKVEHLARYEFIGIYFGGSFNVHCKEFVDKLKTFYRIMKKAESPDSLEVIYGSVEDNESQYREQVKDMPWCRFPHGDPIIKNIRKSRLNLSGSPRLVVIQTKTNHIVDTDDRKFIACEPKEVFKMWRKECESANDHAYVPTGSG